jgi:outer membrane protein assembly factor BamB
MLNLKWIAAAMVAIGSGATMLGVVLLSGDETVHAGGQQGRATREASWPEFHGPGRTNMSPDTGLLKKWPDGGPPLLWTYNDCGDGYSGVSIAAGMIFTVGDFDDEERIIALSMDGKLLWTAVNGAAWRGSCPGSRSIPTYDDGLLFQMTPVGRIAAFEAPTGKEVWAVDLKERFDAQHGIWALAENVIVDGPRVLCMPGGPKGRIVALDKKTGKTLWVNTDIEETAAYCSPAVVTHAGVRQMITLTQRSVVGVNVETGELVWSAPFVPRSPQNALTPLYHEGHVFVACGHFSGGTLLKIEPETRSASNVWFRRELDNCHAGSFLIDGRLYGCSCRNGGKQFYCVDFKTGETLQTDRTLGKVGMTWAEGMLYCIGHQGTLSLLAVTPTGFDIVSQHELKRKPANSYLAHPVVCGGRLYIRSENELLVFDVRAK